MVGGFTPAIAAINALLSVCKTTDEGLGIVQIVQVPQSVARSRWIWR
jgi:hypothetical protein|eukprot:COSAG01_NODE_2988_length_6750_cov_2.101338_4_plen_47_part_00